MIKFVPRTRKIFIKKLKFYRDNLCKVVLINPPSGAYDYLVKETLIVGQLVIVPLRKKLCVGVVVGKGSGYISKNKLRYIEKNINLPSISINFLNFCNWTAKWTMSDFSLILKMSLPDPKFLNSIKSHLVLFHNKKTTSKTTKLGKKIEKIVSKNPGLTISQYIDKFNVSRSVVNKLVSDQVLFYKKKEYNKKLKNTGTAKKLSTQQRKAYEKIEYYIKKEINNVFLLDGVTGSGKTEVYLKIIEKNIQRGKQSLILLPEISLSTQLMDRFYEYFGEKAYSWHSEVSFKQRHATWQAVINGDAKVVIGARSALFLPFTDLGIIVVDEEHDISYKQEDGVIYNARDMAVSRASISKINIILVSATPSIESTHNVDIKKYKRIKMKERFGPAIMPSIKIIDMRKKNVPSNKWLSDQAIKQIKKTLENNEQSLLFINRRGYSPLTLCKICGFKYFCPDCSTWLVTHKQKNILLCHHCGYKKALDVNCPSCSSAEDFIACGPGVERLAEEVEITFPQAKLAVLSSDTLKSFSNSSNLFRDIADGRYDIIVGTQVVAKGNNFPLLTTVIAVDADLSLVGGDFRASERTFQLLTQLSGRAGRHKKEGNAYIQTYDPSNSVLRSIVSGDRRDFFRVEQKNRKLRQLSPFGRLASIIVSSRELNRAEDYVKILSKNIGYYGQKRIKVLGPAPAPINRLRGRYRFRFLLIGPKQSRLQPFISEWLGKVNIKADVKIKIDIDPYNFL